MKVDLRAPLTPSDQKTRDRFTRELETNFSVIAPAGVGKTSSIVGRVLEIAKSFHAREWLPKLVVATYTNRAADEMQQRARNAILQAAGNSMDRDRINPEILASFNRTFFGTIHSFCSKLLHLHGHHLGIPSKLELVEDDLELWHEFTGKLEKVGHPLPLEQIRHCFRHRSMMDVIRLARRLNIHPGEGDSFSSPVDFPRINPDPILHYVSARKNSAANVALGKERIKAWIQKEQDGEDFLPMPVFDKGGGDFISIWKKTFDPLRRWLDECSLAVACDLAERYRQYRLNQGYLTYDDQVHLAAKLMEHAEAGRRLRSEGFRIILDEAQDTDEKQFQILTELARPPSAKGDWIGDGAEPPRGGHFCMVGDPQQSIYGSRANICHYLKLHESLKKGPCSEELKYSVTFRCDTQIIQWVNDLAAPMLNGEEGQVSFVRLQERPRADRGQVARLDLRKTPELEPKDGKKTPVGAQAKVEAEQLVKWLQKTGLKNLRAREWSEVAILCPRKKWLAPISEELARTKIPFQIHSTNDLRGDNPAYAWFTSLTLVMANLQENFELVGVLREIFGLSDQQLADFSRGEGDRFQIVSPPPGTGPVEKVLRHLAETRQKLSRLPLRDAAVEMVRSTQLRQRLESIRSPSAGVSSPQLDHLLIQAAIAEADGLGWKEWAEALKEGFFKMVETEAIEKDSLQLITCQKAKGLEWDAVIIPFLFRKIRDRKPDYPRVGPLFQGGTPSVLFNSNEIGEEEDEIMSRAGDQEMQRILYVAMTRARRTLVLVNDSEIFPPPKNEGKTKSFANHLSLDQDRQALKWKNLATSLASDPSLGAPGKEPPYFSGKEKVKNPLPAGRGNAADFSQRVLPHTLAKEPSHEEPEKALEWDPEWPLPPARDASRHYGVWWHLLMQKFWSQGSRKGEHGIQMDLLGSPDPRRAEKEWALFLKSGLVARLEKSGLVIHPEMPFLWNRGPKECMEGLVDLAALDPNAREWLIVDWKTDRMKPDESHLLLERYSPQISAYGEALTALSGFPSKKIIYSTSTGLEIPVE